MAKLKVFCWFVLVVVGISVLYAYTVPFWDLLLDLADLRRVSPAAFLALVFLLLALAVVLVTSAVLDGIDMAARHREEEQRRRAIEWARELEKRERLNSGYFPGGQQ